MPSLYVAAPCHVCLRLRVILQTDSVSENMDIKREELRDLFVIDFVQFVSSPTTHSKRLKKIRKTMESCPANLSELQWMKMWRGFYYAIWYAEMQKGGEELIEEMGTFTNPHYLLSGFKSLAEAWQGIDAFRIDKYMFLIRIMLRNLIGQQINALKESKVLFEKNLFLKSHSLKLKNEPQSDSLEDVAILRCEKVLNEIVDIKANVIDYILSVCGKSVGLQLHICDIFLDEMEKHLENEIQNKSQIMYELLVPFAKRLALVKDSRLRKSIKENIFKRLLEQTAAESIEFRLEILKKLNDCLVKIASQVENVKCRVVVYGVSEVLKEKIDCLSGKVKTRSVIKRKVVGFDQRRKKVKYQLTATVPFPHSIVPLPVI